MNRWVRRGAVAAAAVVLLAGAAVLVGTQLGERRMKRQVAVTVQPVAPATSPAAIEG